ncbi:MAG: CoA transferase [Deltaproteobacteria bacterium]|nr:MAG: CoA transferase [Deltaproteobacteria bacterium]
MEREKYFEYTENIFDLNKVFDKPEALKDIRVVEFGTLVLGPATATFLGELGAEVIKVELPGAGDTMRSLTPWGQFWKNAALGWLSEARNKYHVAIDVHTEKGQELFKELISRSDVLVENMRAGTLERKFGIGYRQLKEINPRLIYIANSGFGQWGPFSVGRASYDAVAQAVSGLASITGFPGHPPLKAGIWVGDYYGALMAAVSVLAALYYRDKTGKGQYIDFSQSENLIRALDWTWIYYGLTGENRERAGNRDLAIAPSNIYRARDGFVAVSAINDDEFRNLVRAMGREDLLSDSRFENLEARLIKENSEALDLIIKEWVSDRSVREVEELGEKFGFGAAGVKNAKDHYESEHLRVRGSVWSVDDPIYGEVVEYGPVPKLSETPGRIKWAGKPVGFDNEKIIGELLGYSHEEIRKLEEEGVIGKWADAIGRKPPEDFEG